MGNKAIKPNHKRLERVKILMHKEGLTQAALAEKMGITQQRVNEFLRTGKISDYYFEKIEKAFPEYLHEWLDGYGDSEIATKDDLARHNFEAITPLEEDMTEYFNIMDQDRELKALIEKLDQLAPNYRTEVLTLLNKIVEPYTLIPGWER